MQSTTPPPIVVPSGLLLATASHKRTLFVYCWIAFHDGEPITAHDLSRICKTKRDDVFASLTWLCDAGWLVRQPVPGKATVYTIGKTA